MKRYLLNSPVLTDYGQWRFEGPVSLDHARAFTDAGFHSAIGHAATARFLTLALGIEVACRRESISMQPGDQALVLRLLDRLPEGAVLDAAGLSRAPLEFGLLTRLV